MLSSEPALATATHKSDTDAVQLEQEPENCCLTYLGIGIGSVEDR